MLEVWKDFVVRTVCRFVYDSSVKPKRYRSRRPCPACGRQMVYNPTNWSNISGRHMRSCEDCGLADDHPVKLVKQL